MISRKRSHGAIRDPLIIFQKINVSRDVSLTSDGNEGSTCNYKSSDGWLCGRNRLSVNVRKI